MKNNKMNKNGRHWTALTAMLLCAVMSVTAVTGCGAKSAQPTAPQPISGQIEQTEPAKSIEPDERTSPTEPTTPAEPAEQETTDEFSVKITDLGNGAFRMEDAGFTPGLDLTVTVPESWAGRYTYQIFDTEISFYCKATYDTSYDEGYHGNLCGIWVCNEVISPDEPMWGDSRVLATADNYSVVLSCPGDVQYTAETQEEYQSMYVEMDQMKIADIGW